MPFYPTRKFPILSSTVSPGSLNPDDSNVIDVKYLRKEKGDHSMKARASGTACAVMFLLAPHAFRTLFCYPDQLKETEMKTDSRIPLTLRSTVMLLMAMTLLLPLASSQAVMADGTWVKETGETITPRSATTP